MANHLRNSEVTEVSDEAVPYLPISLSLQLMSYLLSYKKLCPLPLFAALLLDQFTPHSLLFADDLLICGKEDVQEATTMKTILKSLCALFG
jgi:hypothetical protein